MLRSRTPNSPLKKSSPPFSFLRQNVHPLSWPLVPLCFIQNTTAAMAINIEPPTPTTTPTTILLVLLKPLELLELELPSDDAEGCELDSVMSEVSVTMTVLPFSTDVKDVVTALPLLAVVDAEVSDVGASSLVEDAASKVDDSSALDSAAGVSEEVNSLREVADAKVNCDEDDGKKKALELELDDDSDDDSDDSDDSDDELSDSDDVENTKGVDDEVVKKEDASLDVKLSSRCTKRIFGAALVVELLLRVELSTSEGTCVTDVRVPTCWVKR